MCFCIGCGGKDARTGGTSKFVRSIAGLSWKHWNSVWQWITMGTKLFLYYSRRWISRSQQKKISTDMTDYTFSKNQCGDCQDHTTRIDLPKNHIPLMHFPEMDWKDLFALPSTMSSLYVSLHWTSDDDANVSPQSDRSITTVTCNAVSVFIWLVYY